MELASGEYRNGYYRVRTALPEEGWLWARNVRILSVSPGRSTTAYVLQPSNLRPVPSTSESPLGIIEPGSEVTILESQSVQGYFKVRTRSGEEGWLWAQNLGLYAPRSTLSEPPVSAGVPPTVLPTATGSPTPTSTRPGALALPSAAVAPGSDASRSGASAEASVQKQEAVPDHTPVAQDQGAQAKQQAAREYGLRPGMILDTSTAALAQGLLPLEIWQHYAAGKYRSRVVDYPTGNPNWEHSFVEATKENKQRLTVDERGSIIDKITGKMPDYLYGLPFPDIDPSDPNAGVKAVWNYFVATWYLGNYHMRTRLVMMSAKGVEREVGAEAWALYRDGQPIKYRRENPMNFQVQFFGFAVSPADMQGTALLYWRYRDPELRDSQWVFVPALRRVRAFAPANRSHGLMGSDISGDDGDFFDGKPQEFRWRLLEKCEALRVVDPESLLPNALTPRPGKKWGMAPGRRPTSLLRLPNRQLVGTAVGTPRRRGCAPSHVPRRGRTARSLRLVWPTSVVDRRRNVCRGLPSKVRLEGRAHPHVHGAGFCVASDARWEGNRPHGNAALVSGRKLQTAACLARWGPIRPSLAL